MRAVTMSMSWRMRSMRENPPPLNVKLSRVPMKPGTQSTPSTMRSDATKQKGRREADLSVSGLRRRSSVLRDDRAAPAIVDSYRCHVDVLMNVVGARDGNGGYRERNVAGAHEQVVVFNGIGPVRRKTDFNSGPDSTAPAGFARLIIFDARCGEEGAVFVVGDRSAALHVPRNVGPGVADLAGEEADDVDLGLVGRGN